MPPWTCGADPVDTGVNFSCDTTCEMYYNFKGGSQSPASRVGLNRKRPILSRICAFFRQIVHRGSGEKIGAAAIELRRSEEHTSELQSLMRISYAVFCLKKKIIH